MKNLVLQWEFFIVECAKGCMDRRKFLHFLGSAATTVAIGGLTGLYDQHVVQVSSKPVVQTRGIFGKYFRFVITPRATLEGLARNILGSSDTGKISSHLKTDLKNTKYIDIPVEEVSAELQLMLAADQFITIELHEDIIKTLQDVCDHTRLQNRPGFERMVHAVLALNHEFTQRPTDSFHNKDRLIIPEFIIRRDKNENSLAVKQYYGLPFENKTWQQVRQEMDDSLHPFGAPRPANSGGKHMGIDLPCGIGTPLRACAPGRFVTWGNDPKGGLIAVFDTLSGIRVQYMHCSRLNQSIKYGQLINQNTILGWSGETGNATGTIPHVHVKMTQEDGKIIDPTPFFAVGTSEWKEKNQRFASALQNEPEDIQRWVDEE